MNEYMQTQIYKYIWIHTLAQRSTHSRHNTHTQIIKCIANPTWGDIFERSFKAQSSKLERLFSLKSGKRDVRALALSFETAFVNVTQSEIGCIILHD